jgi:hypothetical protein
LKKKQIRPLDPSRIKTTSLRKSSRKVKINEFAKPVKPGMTMSRFLDGLPDILAAKELKEVAQAIARASRGRNMVILAMGAHLIKVGLSPLIVDLLEQGIISAVALNGAGAVHEFEIALTGKTSEEVAEAIEDGSFGMARETGIGLNQASLRCLKEDVGLGEAVGAAIWKGDFPYKKQSILAQAFRLNLPATVHVAVGTDIHHMHPQADGAAIGKGTLHDFRLFAACVAKLRRGVYLNIGSAVILPEVFLKALSLARNLGHPAHDFLAVNMDFIQHYRPTVNVTERPVAYSGRGVRLTGHHEIMVPLLFAAVKEALKKR